MMNQQLFSKDADIADLKGQVDEERAKSSGRSAASGDDNLRMLLEEKDLEVAKARADGEERVMQVHPKTPLNPKLEGPGGGQSTGRWGGEGGAGEHQRVGGCSIVGSELLSVCRLRARCLGRLRTPGGVPLRPRRSQTRSTRLLPSTHP